jgi:hypothetical protein
VAGTAKMAARKQWIPIICRSTARCASMPARWPS